MRARSPAILNFLWRQRTASEGKLGKTLRDLGNRLPDLSPHHAPSHSPFPPPAIRCLAHAPPPAHKVLLVLHGANQAHLLLRHLITRVAGVIFLLFSSGLRDYQVCF